MRARAALLLMTMLAAACSLGPGRYRHAASPEGASVTIELAGGTLGGELLESTAEGVLLLDGGRAIHFIPYADVREAEVTQFPDLGWAGGQSPGPRELALLRRISRFPQGTTPQLRAKLLEAYGQTEVRRPE